MIVKIGKVSTEAINKCQMEDNLQFCLGGGMTSVLQFTDTELVRQFQIGEDRRSPSSPTC